MCVCVCVCVCVCMCVCVCVSCIYIHTHRHEHTYQIQADSGGSPVFWGDCICQNATVQFLLHSTYVHSTLFTTQYTLYYTVHSLLHSTLFTTQYTCLLGRLYLPECDGTLSKASALVHVSPSSHVSARMRRHTFSKVV